MSEQFKIIDEHIYKISPVPGSLNCFIREPVMDKQTFVDAYKKWILEKEEHDEQTTNKRN